MMFADLVDFEDLAGQLREFGVELSPTAEPDEISVAASEWIASASADQRAQALSKLTEFYAGSQGLILPEARESLEVIISELETR